MGGQIGGPATQPTGSRLRQSASRCPKLGPQQLGEDWTVPSDQEWHREVRDQPGLNREGALRGMYGDPPRVVGLGLPVDAADVDPPPGGPVRQVWSDQRNHAP